MRLLLDTHALLWMFSSSHMLSAAARAAIADSANELCFSVAGYWEIGIKQSLGKLDLADGWEREIPKEMAWSGISWLGVEPAHIHEVARLPWIHRDPFDRMLIAQARVEKLGLISRDAQLAVYGVDIVW